MYLEFRAKLLPVWAGMNAFGEEPCDVFWSLLPKPETPRLDGENGAFLTFCGTNRQSSAQVL